MENRETILAKALELFSSYGYDGTGVQSICEAAGVTKPTLYYHFGSKEGLLDALLETHFEPFLETVRDAALYARDLPLTLGKIAGIYLRFAVNNPVFYRMQLAMWFAPSHSRAFGAVASYCHRQQQLMEELFTQAVEQHGNMRGRHRAYAAAFLGMINTYAGLLLNGHTELSEDLVYRAVHQFMHGIFS